MRRLADVLSPWRRALLAPLFAVLGLLAVAAPSSAHTSLVGSEPAAGEQLDAPPEHVRLAFSEEVLPRFLTVRLSIGGGAPVDLPARADGAVVTADVPAGIAATASTETERWQADYRVVARDGHPVTGTVEFTVGASGATTEPSRSLDPSATPDPTASRTDVAPPPAEPRRDEGGGIRAPWLLLGSLTALVLVSVAAGVARRRR